MSHSSLASWRRYPGSRVGAFSSKTWRWSPRLAVSPIPCDLATRAAGMGAPSQRAKGRADKRRIDRQGIQGADGAGRFTFAEVRRLVFDVLTPEEVNELRRVTSRINAGLIRDESRTAGRAEPEQARCASRASVRYRASLCTFAQATPIIPHARECQESAEVGVRHHRSSDNHQPKASCRPSAEILQVLAQGVEP